MEGQQPELFVSGFSKKVLSSVWYFQKIHFFVIVAFFSVDHYGCFLLEVQL